MQLRPVTFRYKDTAEKGQHALQYGLIAEEVARICSELVQYDRAGRPFTIYYHLLTPMLLNEFQKVHRGYEAQSRQIAAQRAEIASLKASHNAEIMALKAALRQQGGELAIMKQAQQQQRK